jgi:predicted protein tyrosine phosphatase
VDEVTGRLTLSRAAWASVLRLLNDEDRTAMEKRIKRAKPDERGLIAVDVPEGYIDNVVEAYQEAIEHAMGEDGNQW